MEELMLDLMKNDRGGETRINNIVTIRSTKTKIMLTYKGLVVAEFDLKSIILKDYSYHYYKANGYDETLKYWLERFRQGLFQFI